VINLYASEACINRLALAAILTSSALLPATNAHAATFVYEAALSGPNEAPPNASPATGFTTVWYDNLAHTLRVQVTFSGLTAPNTASHIHVGVPTGGVVTTTPTFTGFPTGVTSGSYDNTFDLTLASSWNPSFLNGAIAGGSTAAAEAYLNNGLLSGTAYLNIHTTNFPGGEIRGFLTPAVPEPATWALLLLGFGLIGTTLRRGPALAKAAAAA